MPLPGLLRAFARVTLVVCLDCRLVLLRECASVRPFAASEFSSVEASPGYVWQEAKRHIAIISSIQDLAKAFSICAEEVMTKKEDLLQYVRDAVSGLKLNAEEERLDADIVTLTQLIAEKQGTAFIKADVSSLQFPIGTAQGASGEFALLLTEGSGKTKELIQLNVQLRDLLQRKKLLFYEGDTQATRTEKVELLKTIMGSLQKASLEAENQISENRSGPKQFRFQHIF